MLLNIPTVVTFLGLGGINFKKIRKKNVEKEQLWYRKLYDILREYITITEREIHKNFQCKTLAESSKKAIITDYKDVEEEAMSCLEDGFEDDISVRILPEYLRKYFQTFNQIERMNKEQKRRSKVIGIFLNEDFLMRFMGAFLVERSKKLVSIRYVFKTKTYQELIASGISDAIVKKAEEQRQLQVA